MRRRTVVKIIINLNGSGRWGRHECMDGLGVESGAQGGFDLGIFTHNFRILLVRKSFPDEIGPVIRISRSGIQCLNLYNINVFVCSNDKKNNRLEKGKKKKIDELIPERIKHSHTQQTQHEPFPHLLQQRRFQGPFPFSSSCRASSSAPCPRTRRGRIQEGVGPTQYTI